MRSRRSKAVIVSGKRIQSFGGSSRLSKGKGRRLLWTDSDASIPPAEERSGQCKLRSHLPTVDAMPLTQSQSLSPLPSATIIQLLRLYVVVGCIRPYPSPSLPIITSYSVLLNALVYGPALLHPIQDPILVFTSEGGGHFKSGRVRRIRRAVSFY